MMLRRFARFRRGKRDGRRGTAAVEFALAMFVLTPIMIGICEYAYYFYIGLNAVEAERAGLLAAANTSGVGTSCSSTSAVHTAQGAASTAVSDYFALNSLGSVVTVISSSDQPSCVSTAPSPHWTMSLVIDYHPLFGFTMPWEKKSPTTGYLRYSVGQLAMRGTP